MSTMRVANSAAVSDPGSRGDVILISISVTSIIILVERGPIEYDGILFRNTYTGAGIILHGLARMLKP